MARRGEERQREGRRKGTVVKEGEGSKDGVEGNERKREGGKGRTVWSEEGIGRGLLWWERERNMVWRERRGEGKGDERGCSGG